MFKLRVNVNVTPRPDNADLPGKTEVEISAAMDGEALESPGAMDFENVLVAYAYLSDYFAEMMHDLIKVARESANIDMFSGNTKKELN